MTSPRRSLPPTNRGGAIRREPARDAASWTDVLISLAATALAMAVLVLVAAFAGENVAGDEAGRFWARLCAGGRGLSGLFLLLLGLVLLGEGAGERGRYLVPVATGMATGVIVGALVLDGAGRGAVLAPLLLLLLATPPVRQSVAWLLRRSRGGQRR
ncbi:MAG: hypothetical protein F4152_02985 [Dehalococcoidia bacterium]|nr:hypothetical protein [Dehalococcoidia bacterium]